MAPVTEPGTSPRALETLAVTGGRPTASRTGKVISVPDPTMVLIVPAPIPAARTATASAGDIGILHGRCAASPPPGSRGAQRSCQPYGVLVEGCPVLGAPAAGGQSLSKRGC